MLSKYKAEHSNNVKPGRLNAWSIALPLVLASVWLMVIESSWPYSEETLRERA